MLSGQKTPPAWISDPSLLKQKIPGTNNQTRIRLKKKTRMAHDLACQQVTCRQQLGPTKNLFLPLHPDDEKAGSIKSISIEKKPQKRVCAIHPKSLSLLGECYRALSYIPSWR
jgi:hypothetical protein